MPGPALHHLIAERLAAQIQKGAGLGRLSAEEYKKLQHLLSEPKNLPYLFFGCQGPDFQLFNANDINPTLGQLVTAYQDVIDFIEEFKETLLSAVPQPVLDALAAFDETVDEVIEDSALLSELQQTFDDLNRLLDGFLATLLEKVKKFITDFDLYDLLSHPYRDGVATGEKWWWLDAQHYRRTGKFTQAMLEATRDLSSPKHLYALGYLTHVAADTVGHPYVNINSGGPFRSHGQRHKTGENYQDVFNWRNVVNPAREDFNRSQLHAQYNFNFDGNVGAVGEDIPDPFTQLPEGLSQFIADTINRIYQEDADPQVEYGSRVTAERIDDTYRLYYRWWRSTTESGTIPPPVAYSFSAELREVWEKTVDNLGEAGDFLEDAIDSASDAGIFAIFVILAGLIIAAVQAAAALADGIAGAIATLGTSTIRAAACLIYELVYNAFQNFRLGVALNGLAFPMLEHMLEPTLQQFANPANPDPTGAPASSFASILPLLRWNEDFPEKHLMYAFTEGERPHATAAPGSYFNKDSTFYAWGDIPLAAQVIDALAHASSNPDILSNDNGAQVESIVSHGGLGNALTLTAELYQRWRERRPFPDFNLDADRGLGHLCWTQIRSGQPDPLEFPHEIVVQSNPAATVDLRFLP
ncbi:MAG: zinc dependent phospholipase C family protein [Verrucomicrobiota bacterium]|nr:zinc dependent phospholipase C family protein [Verrucomicrobiota bacterium]